MTSNNTTPTVDDHQASGKLRRTFSFWEVFSLGWNLLNCFGGLSFLFVIGFSAGGLPAVLYGFIAAWACSMCMIAIIAECAALYPTAGGCYHFSVFLSAPSYRRAVGYVVGWFNYLGIVFASAGINVILASLVEAIIILWKPDYAFSGRWVLFLLFVSFAVVSWLLNLFMLRTIGVLGQIGCYVSLVAFIGFSIALLAIAPKGSAYTVFVEVFNETGYETTSLVVLLGTFSSASSLSGYDAACHLGEEIDNPTRSIPRILWIALGAQLPIGIMWIVVIGFSITNIDAVVTTPTGVPILEVIRLGLDNSTVAATFFWIYMFVSQFGTLVGAMLSASRQGFAFARDGGMFSTKYLTHIGTRTGVPTYSVHLTLAINVVLACVFMASTLNAILGGLVAFQLLGYAAPALVMLVKGRADMPKTPYSLGKFGYPCAVVSVSYAVIIVVLSVIPQEHPVTTTNMNFATVVILGSLVLMAIAWVAGARKEYKPPSFEVFATINGIDVEDNVNDAADIHAHAKM